MSGSEFPGLGMAVQTPAGLVKPEIDPDNKEGYTLTELNESDERFAEISVDFNNANMKVNKVEMLTTELLWRKYSNERELLQEQRKADSALKLNERYLYHGTSMKKTDICEQGLDTRMSNEGCFGRGIYFSDYPRKCIRYAEKKGGDESYILLVRVILGESKVYPNGKKDKRLRREPEKEKSSTGPKFYDSVEGCPVNHKEFVVYTNGRALVEGIITFTANKKAKKEKKAKKDTSTGNSSGDDDYHSVCGEFKDECDFSSGDEECDSDKKEECYSSCDSDSGSDTDRECGSDSDNDSDHGSDSDSGSGKWSLSKNRPTEEDIEKLLNQKRQKFIEATKVTDEFEVDRYLLRGNMSVSAAVKIHEQMKGEGLPEEEMDEEEVPANDHPLPGSKEWKALSKEEQDTFIEGQIDDFLAITGVKIEEREYAKESLSAVNMNLDKAVLAHYKNLD